MSSTCDGSLVGTWEVKSRTCEGEAINRYEKGECVSAIEPIDGVLESGTLAFSEGGKVTGSVTTQMRSERTYERACVESNTGSTLEEFCADDGTSDLVSGDTTTQTCAMKGDACVCVAEETRTVTLEGEPYETNGTTLTLGQFGFGTVCVESDTVTLFDASGPAYMVWKRVN